MKAPEDCFLHILYQRSWFATRAEKQGPFENFSPCTRQDLPQRSQRLTRGLAYDLAQIRGGDRHRCLLILTPEGAGSISRTQALVTRQADLQDAEAVGLETASPEAGFFRGTVADQCSFSLNVK